MTVDWRVTWFVNGRGHRVITRVADGGTGEILAQTDVQPVLIETRVDETTGQLTTEKPKTNPFGRPVDPIKAQMVQCVHFARGSENDHDWTVDRTMYPRDTEEWTMGILDIPEEAADMILNEQMAEDLNDYSPADEK